jgi:flagellar basal-body rod protein FlgB
MLQFPYPKLQHAVRKARDGLDRLTILPAGCRMRFPFTIRRDVEMLDKFLFEQTNLTLVQKGLDTYALRQKATAHNIANANTHGFRRMEVKFEEELRKALNYDRGLKGYKTEEGHFKIGAGKLEEVEPQPYMPEDGDLHSGVNNVDVDEEMVRLAKAQLSFDFASRMAKNTFTKLRSSIRGEMTS